MVLPQPWDFNTQIKLASRCGAEAQNADETGSVQITDHCYPDYS
jgi:hypothetical protein